MQIRHVLTILSEMLQNRMKYGHVMTEDLPYKPLYFRPGSKRLESASICSDLIGTIVILLIYESTELYMES